MKTLVINGSSRRNGNTDALVNELVKNLEGEKKIVSMFSNISPCIDCRYCWRNPGCSIRDDMQEVYPYLDDCDNIILASPIWFSSLSGPTMNIVSRFQTLFAAKRFRKEKKEVKKKNGVIIIVGGEEGTQVNPTQSAMTIMRFLKVRMPCAMIYSMDTDNIPAAKDEAALAAARKAAQELNRAGNDRTHQAGLS